MKPAPDVTYVVGNDHVFVTDSSSRTILAHVDELTLGAADRSQSVQSRIGKEGGFGYEGGHLLANSTKGGGEAINIVAMLEKVNRGSGHSFGNLEAEWRGLIGGKTPSSVEVNVRPQYDGDSPIPTLVEVDFRVNNGRWQDAEFGNAR